jgi:hypothetical protein
MKIVISEQQLRRIITEETSSTIIVSSGFTASNCDELHAFQSTKEEINGKRITKTIGNMNVLVGDKLQELYNKGINPTVKKVTVNVTGMRVDWTCEIGESTDGKAWLGFTSRGSGCGNQSKDAAESASQKKDIRSIKENIESAYGESNIDIEKFAVKTHSDGGNSFVQIFYRYTKPNSFPPISGGKKSVNVKTTPVDKSNNIPVTDNNEKYDTLTINTSDLTSFIQEVRTKTQGLTVSLYSLKADITPDNCSFEILYAKPGAKDISGTLKKIKRFTVALSTQNEGESAAENILSKNPESKVIRKGTFDNGRTWKLIAVM